MAQGLKKFSGWINIYKPRGISSAKAVALVKKSFKGNKIGHTGTLDPEAEGVLPIAIGEATKLTSYIVDCKKEYVFTIAFGASSSTGDVAGEIIARCEKIPDEEDCLKIVPKFVGKISQIPPAYSAIKINGQRAYNLARSGVEFAIKPREIEIFELELIDYSRSKKTATYRALCSRGTYIRTLAEDISLRLQSLGFVIELRRSKVGQFTEENSVDISQTIESDWLSAQEMLHSRLIRLEEMLDDIPVFPINEDEAKIIKFGQQLKVDQPDTSLIWLQYDAKILAIGTVVDKLFKSKRVFNH